MERIQHEYPMVILKSEREIEKIRASSQIVARTHQHLEKYIVAGITTERLNDLADEFIRQEGAVPSSLGYRGFPKSICTSINEVIVHGIPGARKLKNGDVITIDITVFKDGYHGDSAKTFMIGKVSNLAQKLVQVTKDALRIGIEQAQEGNRLGDIGHAIETFVNKHGFATVRDFTGHGIGRGFHEAPQVLHYGKAGTGLKIKKGMVFTIEPMINVGTHKVRILKDGWTAVTRDGSLSAQFEHTVAITTNGTEVLSQSPVENLC
ncbi:type I methionyl aminopeptidase [candidate division CSSED10-310 bacterium]|uniref:Methionine aminopeptidase n=1 Tax=candidate division CSSED10-310 bacterium TaxID=2855610 RepID=A0ABV6YSQ9_UNCC1